MSYVPRFQAQNPAISGYRYGWSSCTAFSTAMVIDASTGGTKRPTGGQVRNATGDFVGGTNLAEMDDAAKRWGEDIDVHYRMPWDQFAHFAYDLHRPYILQGGYGPIADSRYDAGNGFRANHAVAGINDVILDPLADGRHSNVYKYHQEDYPSSLMKAFAGALDIGGRRLGLGLVYAGFLPAAQAPNLTWLVAMPKGEKFVRYLVRTNAQGKLQIYGRTGWSTKTGFHLACTNPTLVLENPASGLIPARRTLVRVQVPGASYNGWWVDAKYAEPK